MDIWIVNIPFQPWALILSCSAFVVITGFPLLERLPTRFCSVAVMHWKWVKRRGIQSEFQFITKVSSGAEVTVLFSPLKFFHQSWQTLFSIRTSYTGSLSCWNSLVPVKGNLKAIAYEYTINNFTLIWVICPWCPHTFSHTHSVKTHKIKCRLHDRCP